MRLDTRTRTLVHANGSEVALTGAEYRLLAILLAHATRVLTRMQLMELVRGANTIPSIAASTFA